MRKLSTEKRAAILSALVEGNSVNAAARMSGASKITVLRLLADAGSFCARFHDERVRNVEVAELQCDELWSFVGCKARTKARGGMGHGDAWVWVGIDRQTKLVVGYHVGGRDGGAASCFMRDLGKRIPGKVSISTDSLNAYRFATWDGFQARADYAQVHKQYATTVDNAGRYSPPQCVGCEKKAVRGSPNMARVSTSHVERQNLTVRMRSRRFGRLTNAFSKKLDNHTWAVHLHYWAYNWQRKHQTLKTTPAVAAGLADAPLTMLELVTMIEAEERVKGGRLTDYLPAFPKPARSSGGGSSE